MAGNPFGVGGRISPVPRPLGTAFLASEVASGTVLGSEAVIDLASRENEVVSGPDASFGTASGSATYSFQGAA